jgi:hypothetical protein
MFKFIRNIAKAKKMQSQIEKYKLRTELTKYKLLRESQISKGKVSKVNSAIREIQSADELKKLVAELDQKNVILQVLENESVKNFIKIVGLRLMGGGTVSAGDDEIISLYKKMPDDIKNKAKTLLLEFAGSGK